MPQINGVVTDDGTTQTTTYTGTATNKIQTFFFSNKQNGFILTNNDTAILTLKVSGRSYIINAEESVSISQECSSFNIIRSGVGSSEFSLTAYLFHSGNGEVPNIPKPSWIVEDNLTSLSATTALSANQGRLLSEQLADNTKKTSHIVHIEQYINLVPGYNTISDSTQWNWTSAWNQAISDLRNNQNGYKVLMLGGRNYNISTNTIVDFPLSIQGVYSGRKFQSDNGGSKIVDNYTGSSPFIQYKPKDPQSQGNRIWGGIHIQNIFIDGKNAQHDCFNMINTAWEMHIDQVFIQNFGGSALYCDTVYDSNINGLTIFRCGGMLVNSSPRYAIVLDSSYSDCTNALHFFGLHIEECRYMLQFKKARHNQFIGCKFEAYESKTINSDLVNPYIWVDSVSLENQFIGTMFVPPRAEDWLSLGFATSITQVPYFIKGMGSTITDSNFQSIIIDSCPVTNPPGQISINGVLTGVNGGGSRFVSSDPVVKANFKISNCHIDNLHGGDYGIYLIGNSSSITNCKIGVQVDGNGSCYGIRTDNASVIGNSISSVFRPGVTVTNDTAILGSNGSLITDNTLNGFSTKVLGYSGTTNLQLRRKKNFVRVSESLFMQLHGLSSINYSNVMVDISKFDTSHLAFEFNSNFTINGIINGQDADEIYLHNNKGGITMTIANNVNNATNSLIVTKTNANTNISANQLSLFKFTGWQWMQVT